MARLVAIIAGVALAVAVLPWPYGYYMLLRVLVCGAGVYLAIVLESSKEVRIGLVLMAVLFNPIVPVHLTREIWAIFNIGGAVFFVWVAARAGTLTAARRP